MSNRRIEGGARRTAQGARNNRLEKRTSEGAASGLPAAPRVMGKGGTDKPGLSVGKMSTDNLSLSVAAMAEWMKGKERS
jgi:hypothetical protein